MLVYGDHDSIIPSHVVVTPFLDAPAEATRKSAGP